MYDPVISFPNPLGSALLVTSCILVSLEIVSGEFLFLGPFLKKGPETENIKKSACSVNQRQALFYWGKQLRLDNSTSGVKVSFVVR